MSKLVFNERMKRISIALMIVLLISGCKGGLFGKKGDYTPTITSRDIYQGREGLEVEFFDDVPPAEVFESSVLPIGLRLYNRGAFDIKNGYLTINLERDYMELNDMSLKSITDKVNFRDLEHIQFELIGKTVEHPKGEYEVITFTANTGDLSKIDPQSEMHTSLVSVTSCYEYQTKAVETVCIDTDVYGFKKREKSCEVETLTLDSQGAPVAVTKIESEMLPNKENPSEIKPRFSIEVKNLGGGGIIKKEKVEAACYSGPVGRKEWDYINVKAYLSTMSEEDRLDCDTGIIILKEGEGNIMCSYEKGFDEKKGTFASPLYVVLEYGYTGSISREVKIKKIVVN